MKNSLKRISAGLLALLMMLSLVFTVIPSDTFAASITYSTTSNSGTRDEICTTLDGTGAEDYYTSTYAFDALSQQNSSQLLQSLRTLMTSTHKKITSYSDCKNYATRTDCESGDGRVLLLYTSYSATMSQYNGWNREHVWPQSLGGGNTSGGGADLHHVRPSDAGVNSSRGNKKYGESNNGTAKYGSNPATGYLGGTYNSTYFEPLDNVKGDVARICLYVYVRWGSAWGADGITEVFQSVDVLLDWMELDPVDTWEMGRNEVVENIQGNRNVFIDYPEYAWLLFGRDVPEGITTPSDNDGMSANPGGNGGNNSGNTGSGGNSGTVTDSKYTQVSTLNDGDKIVIVNPASNMALSTSKTGFYNVGVDVSGGFGSISDKEIFTAKKNSDGTWSFTSGDGQKLAMGTEYSSLNETGTNDKWTLSSAGTNQFYLLNTGRDLYLEWYASKNNWSAYNPDSLTSDYILAFYTEKTTGSGGNSGNTGNSGGTTTTKPATQPNTKPATQPATQPSTQATQPATQPSNQPSTNASTSMTKPAPAPLATNSVPAPTVNKGNQNSNPDSWILIVILVAAALLIGGGIAVYIFVIKPKKAAPVDEAVSDEEISDNNE